MEKYLASMEHLSVFQNRNLIVYICLFFFVLLAQQVTYIVSSLFVGQISAEYIFGNTAQLALNAIFLSFPLFGLFLLGRYLSEKLSGHSVSDLLLILVLVLAIPVVLFALAVRPTSVPIDLNYRGCAVRISGELTSCGFWSATSDLLAMLLISIVVVMVFQGIKPREN